MAKSADTEAHVLKGQYITAARMSNGSTVPITRTAEQIVDLLQPFVPAEPSADESDADQDPGPQDEATRKGRVRAAVGDYMTTRKRKRK